jgi:hypothetical protein
MNPNTSRNATVVVLLILTLALILSSVFIALRLQTSTAPDQAGAAGYGETADPTLFDEVTLAFSQTDCRYFVSELKAEAAGYTELAAFFATARSQGKQFFPQDPFYPNPLSCLSTFGPSHVIQMKVVTYSDTTVIDNSPADLYNRVNSKSLATILDEGDIEGGYHYTYGMSSVVDGICVGNIFQTINDFQSITLYYLGFDCAENATLNAEYSAYLGSEVSALLGESFGYDPDNVETFTIIEDE